MILKHKWAKEAIKNKVFIENMNFHFLDLTVKLCAFDFDTYDGSPMKKRGAVGLFLRSRRFHLCMKPCGWCSQMWRKGGSK